jgi:hypothetical protein
MPLGVGHSVVVPVGATARRERLREELACH